LPHFLEIEQEQMMEAPGDVAAELAAYLEVPEKAEAIAASLKTGKQELTGAGLTNATLADTNWTEEQIAIFTRLCGRTMERFGYVVDGVSS
jgi:hypothetical protein